MSSRAPYTSNGSPYAARRYQRVARVGSLSAAVQSDFTDSPGERRRDNSLSKRRLTICVVGSGGVGKSSLTVRYLNDHFPEFYDPTVEESYTTQIEYGFDTHDLEIIDTAGQEEFMLFRDTALAQGDAFLVLFAINSISSWYSLQELRDKLVREHDDEDPIPMVIVANKNDLESCRQVQFDEVMEYCKSIGCPVVETSAKTGLNVTESFRLLMDRISELRPTKFRDSIAVPKLATHPQHKKKCIVS